MFIMMFIVAFIFTPLDGEASFPVLLSCTYQKNGSEDGGKGQ